MSIHGYEIRIEKRRWHWYGNFTAFTDPKQRLGISPEYGWRAFTRERLERKLRKQIAKHQCQRGGTEIRIRVP